MATWNLGCFLGAMLTIWFGDRYGRKGSIITGLVLMSIGKIIQVSSFSFGQYIAGRLFAGFGNGIIASTVPSWQAVWHPSMTLTWKRVLIARYLLGVPQNAQAWHTAARVLW